MKYYILGSSGSGKSYLGKIIAQREGIPYFDLDQVMTMRNGSKPTQDEAEEYIQKLLRENDSFVIDGVYLFPTIFDDVDKIFLIYPNFLTSLYSIWIRELKRREYPLSRTVKLSKQIFKQYFYTDYKSYRYFRYKVIIELLKPFHDKVTIFSSRKEVNHYLNLHSPVIPRETL